MIRRALGLALTVAALYIVLVLPVFTIVGTALR